MGFYIAEMVRFYSMPLPMVLALPSRQFAFLIRQQSRIEAKEGLTQIRLMGCIHGEESLKETVDALLERLGKTETFQVVSKTRSGVVNMDDVNEMDPDFDRHALRALKARHG
ncbi:hypothetical protein [Paracoccus litorisediminis]|uniref:Uncharacterized protein n=1 Tax=Paracoccus litorisediminis TaxID=2006130 RepID=A0A844HRZ3_9RHOB|nr:hypothetical protein [Paracoccus litorisediminis]MTH61204.1 hypothetical protein [Paracoccus litorisediminis]